MTINLSREPPMPAYFRRPRLRRVNGVWTVHYPGNPRDIDFSMFLYYTATRWCFARKYGEPNGN